MLTQMIKQYKYPEVSKFHFAKQNEIAGTSAGGLWAAFSLLCSRPRREGIEIRALRSARKGLCPLHPCDFLKKIE